MTTLHQIVWRQPETQPLVDAPCPETVERGVETLYPLRSSDGALAIEICLLKKFLVRLAGDHRGERISCLSGVAWITQTGNEEDILLRGGETFPLDKKGTLLIEGLEETRLKISNR